MVNYVNGIVNTRENDIQERKCGSDRRVTHYGFF